MNILFLEGDMSRSGGTEKMTAWLANELSQKNSVHIISLSFKGDKIFFPLNEKVTHYTLASGNMLKHILQIRKYVKNNKVDVVINVDTGMGIYGILATTFAKIKVITWEHANYFNNWDSKIFPYFRRFAARHSDAVVVLTRKDKQNYLSNIKRCKPVTVIHNPMEEHEAVYDINSKIIFSAGLLCEIKRFDRCIDVAKIVFQKHPDWSWVICGDGPEKGNLEKLIFKNGLSDKIILAGRVENIGDYFAKSAIYVLTSQMEGLPMVLLEAKAHKLPIVSFDIQTGPSDIVSDRQNGFLIEPYSIEQMAEKIELLIENNNLRQQFSDNTVLDTNKFSRERIISQWTNLISP